MEKKTMQQIMEEKLSVIPGATRYVINERTIEEKRGVLAQYAFLAYRGTKLHEGELVKGKFRGEKRNVLVDAYGLIIYRVIEWLGEQQVYDYDMGYLSAKNNETYSVLNRLGRMEINNLDQLVAFVRRESEEWGESFDTAAKKELRHQLGLHNYNPFKGPRSYSPGRGLDA